MSKMLEQIFQELDLLESRVAELNSNVDVAEKQTDLEVAILTEQIKDLRDKNKLAGEYINKSISILKKM